MDENRNYELNGFDSAYKGDYRGEEASTQTPAPENPPAPQEQPPYRAEENAESSFTPTQNSYGFFPSGNYGTESKPADTRPGYYPPHSEPEKPTAQRPKKERSSGHGAGVVFVSVLLALIVGAASGFGASYYFFNYKTDGTSPDVSGTASSGNTIVKTINVTESAGSVVEAVAAKAGASVVGIRTTSSVTNFFGGTSEAAGEGSGVIYRADGYIVTNYHVIESAVKYSNSTISVYLPSDIDTALDATVVGYSIASDLAVIKIAQSGLPIVEIASSADLSVGQYAVAIGNPGGLEFMGSVTYGVISGLNRTVTVEGVGQMSLIQTDAAINPGNSGGGLFNTDGKLIGINSNKLVSTSYEGMGFAIPSDTVVTICDKIIAKENDPIPYVGIKFSTTYDAATLKYLGYPAGAVVLGVSEGSPSASAGVRRGDIITEFDGAEINGYADFNEALSNTSPGDKVTIKLYRSGQFYTTTLTVIANNAR